MFPLPPIANLSATLRPLHSVTSCLCSISKFPPFVHTPSHLTSPSLSHSTPPFEPTSPSRISLINSSTHLTFENPHLPFLCEIPSTIRTLFRNPHFSSNLTTTGSPLFQAHHLFISQLALFLYFHMERTRGAFAAPSQSCTPRQRASSARVPRGSPSQATEAP